MSKTELEKKFSESLVELEKILAKKKKTLGKKANEDPDVIHLESLIKASKVGGVKGVLEIAVSDLKSKVAAPRLKKGRVTLQERINAAYTEWIIKSKESLFDPLGPIKLYSTPKGRQKRIDELKPILLKERKEWLAQELGYAATTIEELKQYKEALEAEIKFLAEKFESFCNNRISAVKEQGAGKEKRFKKNNDSLKAAYDKFEKYLNRTIKSEDFTLFFVTLEHYFPEPPSPEISDLGGEVWALKTVRNYFEKRAGVPAKFSKREASKLKREHFSDNR